MVSKATSKKIKFLPREKWIVLKSYKGKAGQRYAISSEGRAVSFTDEIETGYLLKQSLVQKYPALSIRKGEKNVTFLMHRLLATHFVNKPSPKHKYVIHVDHVKENNASKNLKWVTLEELSKHLKSDPAVINRRKSGKGHILTADQVRDIKTRLFKSKKQPTLKSLAKKFKVSDMQIFRIKSGENWSHIKI
ncbi:MAG TPA: hypothetical protein VIM65_19930 [Cyclobacteriaceae bacterium]